MADEQIVTNIVAKADFSDLLADLGRVQSALTKLQQTEANTNRALGKQIDVMNSQFRNTLRSTGQFSTQFVSVGSDVDKFGRNLDAGRIKLREFYRTWQGHHKTAGGLVRDLAKQQIQLQNAILQPLGKNAQGMMQFAVHVPKGIDLIKNRTKLANMELTIMNRLVQEGAQGLINWGKNTQWAGRQLTVGLTLPILAFGRASQKAFAEADAQLTRLTKVYGDIAGASQESLARIRKDVSATAKELAQSYGAAYNETLALSADIAATGKEGKDLLGSIKETTRLAILGEVDRQEAMKATLAIQTAFKQNTEELTDSINFLNAVENQTSTTLNDLVEAIPKAGPVIKGLGGDVKDLALYITAMREGGISASEGANALKSGLASLINPTKVAVARFEEFGIDLLGIVNRNTGNVTATILELQSALDNLDPLQKQQAIEQLFGKFQFSRLNALFNNLGRQGSQTLQVLDLMKASAADLEAVASRELTMVTESASGKYRRQLETLRANLAEVGDSFLTVSTNILKAVNRVIEFVENLPEPIKKALTFFGGLTALAGPIIMLTGVLGNFFGYIIKGVSYFRALFKGAAGWKLLTPEILAANKAGAAAADVMYTDAKAAEILKTSINDLVASYQRLTAAQTTAADNKIVTTVAGSPLFGQAATRGAGTRQVNPQHPLITPIRFDPNGNPIFPRSASHMVPRGIEQPGTIFGLVPTDPHINLLTGKNPQIYMQENLPKVRGLTEIVTKKGAVSTGVVAAEAARHHAMIATMAMQSTAQMADLKKTIATTRTVTSDFMHTFDDILPITTKLTNNAAVESAAIVAEARAGKISIEQARARIIALNIELERMIGSALTTYAAGAGRTINLYNVPGTTQPVLDPTGRPNMKELYHKPANRAFMDALSGALKVRTGGAGYNIETTIPKRFNAGGEIESFGPGKTQVSGPSSIGYDDRLGSIPVGGYVLNQSASLNPENADLVAMAPYTYENGGEITAALTPKETIFGPKIQRMPELYAAVDAANNGYSLGGNIVSNRLNYGAVPAAISGYLRMASLFGGFRSPGTKFFRASRNRFDYTGSNPQGFSEVGSGSLQYSQARSRTSNIYRDLNNIAYGITPTKKGEALVHAFSPLYVRRLKSLGYGPEDQIPIDILKSIGVPVPANAQYSTLKALSTTWVKNSEKFNQRIKKQGVEARTSDKKGWKDAWRKVSWKDMQSLLGKLKDMGIPPAEAKRIAEFAAEKLNSFMRNYNGTMNEIIWGKFVNSAEIGALKRFSQGRPLVPGYAGGGYISSNKLNYGILPPGRISKAPNLSNEDPAHGLLYVGKRDKGMFIRGRYKAPRVWWYTRDYPAYKSLGSTAKIAWPIGSETDRAKAIMQTYARGDYNILNTPEAMSLIKTLAVKTTGTMWRGVKPGFVTNTFPGEIGLSLAKMLQTGDKSQINNLVGKEFIMRRASWSTEPGVAEHFSRGTGGIQVKVDIKNRNAIPVSSLNPDLQLPDPRTGKMIPIDEKEYYFGGKFRIKRVDFDPNFDNKAYVTLEQVVDDARVYDPRNKFNSGGMIPNYAAGGMITRGRRGYGIPGNPEKRAQQERERKEKEKRRKARATDRRRKAKGTSTGIFAERSRAQKLQDAIKNLKAQTTVGAANLQTGQTLANLGQSIRERARNMFGPTPLRIEVERVGYRGGEQGQVHGNAVQVRPTPEPPKPALIGPQPAGQRGPQIQYSKSRELVHVPRPAFTPGRELVPYGMKPGPYIPKSSFQTFMEEHRAKQGIAHPMNAPARYGAASLLPFRKDTPGSTGFGKYAGREQVIGQTTDGKAITQSKTAGYYGLRSSEFKIDGRTVTRAEAAAAGGNVRVAGMGVGTAAVAGGQMAGMGLMMSGHSGAGMGVMMASMFAPQMISGMSKLTDKVKAVKAGLAETGKTGLSTGKALFSIVSKAKFLAPLGSAVIGITALVVAFKLWRNSIERTRKEQDLMFGTSKKNAEQLGIKYKNINDELKAAKAAADLMRQSGLRSFNALDKVGGGFLTTSKEMKKEISAMKKNAPEVIKTINELNKTWMGDGKGNIDFGDAYGKSFNQLVQIAKNLKTQYISSGLSVDEATKKVYALISATDRSGEAFKVINDSGFLAIEDAATGAAEAAKAYGEQVELGFAGGEQLGNALQNTLGLLLSGSDEMEKQNRLEEEKARKSEKNKDAVYKTNASYKALEETLGNITAETNEQSKLTEANLENIKLTKPELYAMLNDSDTITSSYAKMRLELSGIGINLKEISGDVAISLAKYDAQLTDVIDSLDIFAKSNKLLSLLKQSFDANTKGVQKFAKAEKDAYEKAIERIDARIKKINQEADARKKAIELEFAAADAANKRAQLELEYNNAVAAGNADAAEAARLQLEAFTNEEQKTKALAAIEDKRAKDEQKAQAERDAATKRNTEAQNKLAAAQQKSADIQQRMMQVQAIQDQYQNLIKKQAMQDVMLGSGTITQAQYNKEVEANVGNLEKLSATTAKFINSVPKEFATQVADAFNAMGIVDINEKTGKASGVKATQTVSTLIGATTSGVQLGSKKVIDQDSKALQILQQNVQQSKSLADQIKGGATLQNIVDAINDAFNKDREGATVKGTGKGTEADPFKFNKKEMEKAVGGASNLLYDEDGSLTTMSAANVAMALGMKKNQVFEFDGFKYKYLGTKGIDQLNAKKGTFHNWNGPIPGPYNQEISATLKAGTEGVYQENYIRSLRQVNKAAGNINVGSVTMNFAEAPKNGRALYEEFKAVMREQNLKTGGIIRT